MKYDLTCPECGASMELKGSKFGKFYGCSKWRETRCEGSHGAFSDGTPLGKPADKKTKRKRWEAHQVFDRLWKENHMSRKDAYKWMQVQMHMSEDEAHIGNFSSKQCEELINLSNIFLKGVG